EAFCPGVIAVKWHVLRDESVFEPVGIPRRTRVSVNDHAVAQLHSTVVAHQNSAAVLLVTQGSAVHKRHSTFLSLLLASAHVEVPIFHHDLKYIVYLSPVVVRVNPSRGNQRVRYTYFQETVDAVEIVSHEAAG